MTLAETLEAKVLHTRGAILRDQLSVHKDGTGVHTFVSRETGRQVGPHLNMDEFLTFMPQMGESKCKDYGSDD